MTISAGGESRIRNPFGFADFFADGDAVRVARPVAIAQTVGGQDDQAAVLRMRQGGENTLQLTVYKVDDLSGTIDGVAPASIPGASKTPMAAVTATTTT